MIDMYCERRGPEFWAEPLNALTNLVFLLAAAAAWWSARRHHRLTREIVILIALAAIVGVGSFLFHTFATSWAMYLDMIPIFVFQMDFVWLYSRRQIQFSRLRGGLLLAGLLLTSLPLLTFHDVLNGSLTYLPAWLLLAAFGAYHVRQSKHHPWQLVIAAILLLSALGFRTIDKTFCEKIPYGTHFLWHLINGIVFYLVIQSLILNPPEGSESV